jgi:NTE family protein
MTNEHEWTSLLRKIPLLGEFSPEERAIVDPLFHTITLAAGEHLFRQGEEGNALHLLISGSISVVQERDGKEHIVATLSRRGDLLGEMALLGGEPRPGTATALQPTSLIQIKRTDFEAALHNHPPLAMAVARALTRRLVATTHPTTKARSPGKTFVLMGALPPTERVRFVFALAASTVMQTRRRVLLVDIAEESAEPAVAHLSGKARGIPPNMDVQDFQTIEGLRSLTLVHASGLDIISISEPLILGRLFSGLYPLVTTARQEWDFVFISMPGRSSRAARALWDEADRVLYVREESSEKGGPLWREMESVVSPPRLDLVELQRDSPPRRNRPGRFYVPWKKEAGPLCTKEGLCLTSRAGAPQKGMDRMARHLAGGRIGIAMGSGAALGYSIIGILRALERNGIYPDLIAGTSMGALVGSFYAAGRPVSELVDIALSITKKRLWAMADFDLPWKGVVVGNGVLRFLKSILGDVLFDQLQLPFACVATDINTGTEQVLRHGAVAEAVRGSLSLPFFFEPFFWQGRYLVDGGLVNPVPTSIVQAMGADITLSINNTTAPALKGSPRARRPSMFNPIHGPHIFKVMAKTLYTMQYGISSSGANTADVVIAPKLAGFGSLEFHRAAEIIKIGEEQAEIMMPKILSKFPFTCGVKS